MVEGILLLVVAANPSTGHSRVAQSACSSALARRFSVRLVSLPVESRRGGNSVDSAWPVHRVLRLRFKIRRTLELARGDHECTYDPESAARTRHCNGTPLFQRTAFLDCNGPHYGGRTFHDLAYALGAQRTKVDLLKLKGSYLLEVRRDKTGHVGVGQFRVLLGESVARNCPRMSSRDVPDVSHRIGNV